MTEATSGTMRTGRQMIAQPVLPGLTSDRVATIFATLCTQFEPNDQLEMWWLNDVAHLTARIEHLRLAVRGFYLKSMENIVFDSYSSIAPFDDDDRAVLQVLLDSDFDLRAQPDAQTAAVLERLMGLVLARHDDSIRAFDDLERALLRERDRVFAQFEKRRRERVIEAVQAVEPPRSTLLLPRNR